MSKAVLGHFLDRGSGRIVNISSFVGQTGRIGQANCSAAKAGLFGLTKTLALETAAKGITVNCVLPGAIQTDMVSALPEEIVQAVIDTIPMRSGHTRRCGGSRPVSGIRQGTLRHRRPASGDRRAADDVSAPAHQGGAPKRGRWSKVPVIMPVRPCLPSRPASSLGTGARYGPTVRRCVSRAWETRMNQQKAQALTQAVGLPGRDDEAFRLALSQVWDAAFEAGRIDALDELQDRFCVCMK
jgi:hypothetical protein